MSDVKKRIIDYETAGEVDEDFYILGDNGTEGTFKIPVKAVGPIESICPVYDAEAGTYDEGDYCFYAQKMYQCNTDISVPEDFDSTKWDEITIAEIMASQQSEISTLNASLTNKTTWKLHDSATGQTSISLTDLEYDELCIIVAIGTSNKVSIHIPKIDISSSNSWYRTGGYGGSSGLMEFIAVRVNTSSVYLNNAIYAGTDYIATAVTYVYYR